METAFAEAQSDWATAGDCHTEHTTAVLTLLDQKATALNHQVTDLTILQQQGATHTGGTGPRTANAVDGTGTNGVSVALVGGTSQPALGLGAAGAAANAEAEAVEAKASEDYGLASLTATPEQLPELKSELSDEEKLYAESVWHVLKQLVSEEM